MSASLVGSEMCIRDRRVVKRPGLVDRRVMSKKGVDAAEARLARHAPPDACLLYTSDAADDM
eukprot:2735671-Alexandrium_andersonii.AAC.1